MNVLFVRFAEGTAKSGRPYRMVELSNCLVSKNFSVDSELASEEFAGFKKGDDLTVQLRSDPFDYYAGHTVVAVDRT